MRLRLFFKGRNKIIIVMFNDSIRDGLSTLVTAMVASAPFPCGNVSCSYVYIAQYIGVKHQERVT